MTDITPPIRRTLASFADLDAAVLAVTGLAGRRLLVFEGRLSRLWDGEPCLAALRTLALSNPRHEIRFVTHDADAMRRTCPRLIGLATRFGHVIALREARPEARHVKDALVIADDRHYVHRFHEGSARAGHGLHDPENAAALAGRFAELWEASDPVSPGTTLGL